MSKKVLNVDWKSIQGAAVKRRILKLSKNEEGIFACPVNACLHLGFKSDRGARKHVNTMHPWYFYFDQQPLINKSEYQTTANQKRKSTTHNIPAYSLTEGMGKEFLDWLKTPCGGGKSAKQAVQAGRRAMKFLMTSLGDTEVDKTVSEEFIDCCLGSPSIVINFFKIVTEQWKITSSASLNYMKSINDLMDWRKASGVTDDVLRSFTVSEVYVRRGKENLSKQKKLEYSRNLDLEQLICRKSWATVEEMEQVIPYHTPRYKYVLDLCKAENSSPSVSQLAFATRFITTFLFLRVKCTRPMTYQYITLKMIEEAKTNGGFIDQTAFKTEKQYGFDTVLLSGEVIQIIDSYVAYVRPKMSPSCNYLLLTTNGKQYSALGSAMSILVHQAIEKYVNPTRYRQIIESESAERLTTEEMKAISADQKHSSYVAKRIYQKKLSRDVALQGNTCMKKITGKVRDEHTKEMASLVSNPSCEEIIQMEEETDPQTNDHTAGEKIVVVGNDKVEEMVDLVAREFPTEIVQMDEDVVTNDEVEEVLSVLSLTELKTKEEEVAEEEEEEEDKEKEANCSLMKPGYSTIAEEVTSVSTHTDQESTSRSNSVPAGVSDPGPSTYRHCKNTRLSALTDMPQISDISVEVKKELVDNEGCRGLVQKRFSPQEDTVLKEGIKKHGLGKWSLMLKDKSLNFHPARTRDSIRVRADTLGLTKKKKKKSNKNTETIMKVKK